MKKIAMALLAFVACACVYALEHEYVDLGLPSGTKWATMNVGADSIRGIGAFFAYGDTVPDYVFPGQYDNYERSFDWEHYKWCAKDSAEGNFRYQLTKYCQDSRYGYKGFTDGLSTLLPEDDAATALWGNDWRTPTMEDFIELRANCFCKIVSENGVYGMRLCSRVPGYEDRSIFLPYVGLRDSTKWLQLEDYKTSCYMSASATNIQFDYFAFPDATHIFSHVTSRTIGGNIRPVLNDKEQMHSYVDLGLNVLWATANVGAYQFDLYGHHFAWGDTSHNVQFTWDTYIHGQENALTKYNTMPECGVVDNKIVLDAADDPATIHWENGWRMPDTTDWIELSTKCTWKWMNLQKDPMEKGLSGYLITSNVMGYEGNQIFLPTSGFASENLIINYKTEALYYTKYLDITNPNKAVSVYFSEGAPIKIDSDFRYYGFVCRPVKDKQSTGNEDVYTTNGQPLNVKKILKGGHLLIIRGDKCYNLYGIEE